MTHLEMLATLAAAGFTKNDIAALARASQPAEKDQGPQFPTPAQAPTQPTPAQAPTQPTPAQAPTQPTPAQAPTQPTPAQAPTQAPTQPTPAQAPTQSDFNKLLEELTGIKAAVQGNNLANAQMPGGQPETTDDILASIINPPSMKGV